MLRKILVGSVCVVVTMGAVGGNVLADTLKLKDGTSLNGRVLDEGPSYWVKGADGQTHTVAKDSVDQWVHGDDGGTATPAAAPADPMAGRGAAAAVPAGASFKVVKAKADRVETPIQAVALWQTYIDAKPAGVDAAAAKTQLAYWRQMVDARAERVNGKWIAGPERDKLLAQVRELLKSADADVRSNQTLKGLHEYEAAAKLYPNDFRANFELGLLNLIQGYGNGRNNAKLDAGVKSLEAAAKLRPNNAATLSDLSLGYMLRQKYQASVQSAYQAAKLEDTKEIVGNLVSAIGVCPPAMRQSAKLKPIVEEATLLASKYGISGGDHWHWIRPNATPDQKGDDGDGDDGDTTRDDSKQKGPAGILGNGTGELVSADGYILTNRHVAKEGDYLMVRLSDGTLTAADRVVIDDEQDMAVIKIKTSTPLPFVRLARYDHPPVGEDVAVFGYPLLGMVTSINSSVKMTRGIVTAYDEDNAGCDVTVDAQINPGNSGGPIVDHYGNLLAIATAKTFAGNVGDNAPISSYGLGQSTGRLRTFFEKQKGKLAGLHLVPGSQDKTLTNEELATRLTPATVVVFICRGERPTAGGAKPPGQP